MIVGWASAILMLANVPIAEHLGHALFDGQLYFTGIGQLAVALLFLGATAALLPWLSRRLLLERMFPDFFRASGLSALRYHLIFDLLIAAGLALATSSIGVMASFRPGVRAVDDRLPGGPQLEGVSDHRGELQSWRLSCRLRRRASYSISLSGRCW